ncbi:unnamed protein product [Polarella glacialis]|uniref:DNA 3'-5' helicase n=1 Tax=Polarella glacialis TaxID=89957 RepID=A0A813DFT5_POLGL|nr:unnamed protein product [Polarella glacialis]
MTDGMRRDISEQLRLRDPVVSTLPYFRPNLDITCTHKEGFTQDMARIAEALKLGELTIIYTPKPSTAYKVAVKLESLLKDQGVQVGVYTGPTEKAERERVQSMFDSDEIQVLVATVAFGMGIDKADVRNIIHYGLPKCMEDYHQQIGRAGRDGLPSQCVIIFSNTDWKVWFCRYFTKEYKHWDKEDLKTHLDSTEQLHQLVVGQTCRQQAILGYFGRMDEVELLRRGSLCRCDVCLGRRGQWFGGKEPREFFREARLVLEAVRVTEGLSRSRGASRESVLQLVAFRCEPLLASLPQAMVQNIRSARGSLPMRRRGRDYVCEMFDMLYGNGYLTRQLSTDDMRHFVWRLTDFGRSALTWGKSVRLLPTKEIEKLEKAPEVREEIRQSRLTYEKVKRASLKMVTQQIAALNDGRSAEDPNDEQYMWTKLESLTSSIQELTAHSRATVDCFAGAGDLGKLQLGGLAGQPCANSSALSSDLAGSNSFYGSQLLLKLIGEHLDRLPDRKDVIFDDKVCSDNRYQCFVIVPALNSIVFSSDKTYRGRKDARRYATLHACKMLLARTSCSSSSPQIVSGEMFMSLLLACLARHMQRIPGEEDASLTYFVDSHQAYRCVVMLRGLGGLQFSTRKAYRWKCDARIASILHCCQALVAVATGTAKACHLQMSQLLHSLARHMQRPPRDEDVEFTFLKDSTNTFRCVITVPSLEGLQFSTEKAYSYDFVAKKHSIKHACTVLSSAEPGQARSNTQRPSERGALLSSLLVCLSRHMQSSPRKEDVEITYSMDSGKGHHCAITLHALNCMQFCTKTAYSCRGSASRAAIKDACKMLTAMPAIELLTA